MEVIWGGSRLNTRVNTSDESEVFGSTSGDACLMIAGMTNDPKRAPRVAICGFSIECNRFAPVATRAHFAYFAGGEIAAEARAPAPRMLGEIPGFIAEMDAAGPWEPVGLAFATAEPNGPTDHRFFTELMADIEARLTAALPVDAVYICEHG